MYVCLHVDCAPGAAALVRTTVGTLWMSVAPTDDGSDDQKSEAQHLLDQMG